MEEVSTSEIGHAARQLKEQVFAEDLTADEAAYVLDFDRATVLRYLREHLLVGYQLGREWRIPVEEIRNFRERMLFESRREAFRITLKARAEQLKRNHPYDGWEVSQCDHCYMPLLVSRDSQERKSGTCESCEKRVFVVKPEEDEVSETAAPEDTSTDLDNMPF